MSAFDDHAQVCTTARGYSTTGMPSGLRSGLRRYVGFRHGRVSENNGRRSTIDEFLEWSISIERIISGRSRSLSTFRRYASEDTEPSDPTPLHILLDLFEVEDKYLTIGSEGIRSD